MISNVLFVSHKAASAAGNFGLTSRLPILPSLIAATSRSSQSLSLLPIGTDYNTGSFSDIDSLTSTLYTSVDAWSVGGANLNSPDLASNFFAVSLFPYLALLWYLAQPITKTPPLANFGFRFLLVFVFATIPAGICSKIFYGDILANVDYLHGIAESLLTVTNLLIIQGFRNTRNNDRGESSQEVLSPTDKKSSLINIRDVSPMIMIGLLLISLPMMHSEPANALSLPTWIVHTSSLIEWLVAMKLIWEHAATSDNPRWKGLPWAMIISHASGICACTYHFFYNSPDLNWIVNLQAGLTTTGNAALAFAAYRIYEYEKSRPVVPILSSEHASSSDLGTIQPLPETDSDFWIRTFVKSLLCAVLVKYGELFLDFPFEANSQDALAIISIPVLFNIGKWAYRSNGKSPDEKNWIL